MKNYIILTDVTVGMSPDIREHFGIKDYIGGYIHFSDGRDFKTTLDWENISHDDFYTALSNRHINASTAPASPEEYYNIFRGYAEKGMDILSISISANISSTYNVAKMALARVGEEFPERKLYAFDSTRMAGGMALLVAYAQDMQNSGADMDDVIEFLETNKCRVHQMGPIDDLMVVARRGRISTGKAIMGSFAGVKPMGDCNNDGYVTVLTKAKGIKKALALTVAYIKEAATDIENNYVYISHSNREEYSLTLKAMIESELHPKAVYVSDVFAASGTNIGPGMIAAYFFGDPISEDCAAEKELMNKVIASLH